MKDDSNGTTGIVIEEAEIVDCEGESKPCFRKIFLFFCLQTSDLIESFERSVVEVQLLVAFCSFQGNLLERMKCLIQKP